MVSILLRRELRAGFPRDPVPEDGLPALELAGLVIGINPVGDLAGLRGCQCQERSAHTDVAG